jgi:hypothetical protein
MKHPAAASSGKKREHDVCAWWEGFVWTPLGGGRNNYRVETPVLAAVATTKALTGESIM